MDDRVEKALFHQELTALETLRQFLADGLLDHARAGKANQRAGFGNVEVAQHGKAGGDAAGGGVGQHADVRHLGVIQAPEGGADLGHGHQADGAFHHACAARGADDNERDAFVESLFHGAGNRFADDGTHAAADKAVLHGADQHLAAQQLAARVDDGVLAAGGFLRCFHAPLVGLQVGEVERVGRLQIAVFLHEDTVVKEVAKARAGVYAEVLLALGADVEVGLKVLLPDDLAAALALDPKAFTAHRALATRIQLLLFALKPAHESLSKSDRSQIVFA